MCVVSENFSPFSLTSCASFPLLPLPFLAFRLTMPLREWWPIRRWSHLMQMVRETVLMMSWSVWRKTKGKSHDLSSGPKETNKTPQILIYTIIPFSITLKCLWRIAIFQMENWGQREVGTCPMWPTWVKMPRTNGLPALLLQADAVWWDVQYSCVSLPSPRYLNMNAETWLKMRN